MGVVSSESSSNSKVSRRPFLKLGWSDDTVDVALDLVVSDDMGVPPMREDLDEEADETSESVLGVQTSLRGLERVGWLQTPVSLNLYASFIRFCGTHPRESIHWSSSMVINGRRT